MQQTTQRRMFRRARRPALGAMVGGNAVSLLHDGSECLPAMREAIEGAQREVLLEMYWFGSDKTGRRFAELLSQKARQGVRVWVTYDSWGSVESDRGMFDAMRVAGCWVREYHPVAPWHSRFRIAKVNNRNHRKLLVVDGRIGMTGGVNLSDAWAPKSEGGQGFRDDMIRVQGPVVRQLRTLVLRTFAHAKGAHARGLVPGDDQLFQGDDQGTRLGVESEDAPNGYCAHQPEPTRDCSVAVLANDYLRERRLIRRAYLTEIRRASRDILITNSYFVPDGIVRRALAKAVGRGVRVRVLLPYQSDVPAVRHATRKLYSWLMDRGVELYEWGPTILHSKTAVIDDIWCTVGTFNLDSRSWRYNLEVNLSVRNASVAKALRARCEYDLEHSTRVDPYNWRFRPLTDRVAENFFYLFRRLM